MRKSGFITGIDLLVDLTLIVIPDPSALSREHGLDAQQVFHLSRLAALGLINGMRSPPNSNPLARSTESSAPPRRRASRFTWSKATCLSLARGWQGPFLE